MRTVAHVNNLTWFSAFALPFHNRASVIVFARFTFWVAHRSLRRLPPVNNMLFWTSFAALSAPQNKAVIGLADPHRVQARYSASPLWRGFPFPARQLRGRALSQLIRQGAQTSFCPLGIASRRHVLPSHGTSPQRCTP